MYKFFFIVLLSICIIMCIYYSINKNNIMIKNPKEEKLDKLFYDVDDISSDLNKIDNLKDKILTETLAVYDKNWTDWPEKNLYEKNGQWKIFPFYAFGQWVDKNCIACPNICNFLKQIKGLKLATLSKMSPKMKLTPHKGWGNHSNHVIRCHYGLTVPDGCYIAVSRENDIDEIQYHKKFRWTIFDDSYAHYAENTSGKDRIVLIIDIDRPSHIKTGTSDIGDTDELLEIINYFKNNNV